MRLNGQFICVLLGIYLTSVSSFLNEEDDESTTTVLPSSSSYLENLFNKYGEDGLMTFEGLEHLLENLGLGRLHIADHRLNDHRTDGKFVQLHDPGHQHNNKTSDSKLKEEEEAGHPNHRPDHVHAKHKPSIPNQIKKIDIVIQDKKPTLDDQCMTAQEMLGAFRIRYNRGIEESEFLEFCPALIYQLDHQSCYRCEEEEGGCDPAAGNATTAVSASYKTWLLALTSVAVISVVGLICVATIPILSKSKFYRHVINFLISLAVGTLMGDALLHLLPHAMGSHSDGGANGEEREVWMGLVALFSAFLFYVVEQMHGAKSQQRNKEDFELKEVFEIDSNDKKIMKRLNENSYSDLQVNSGESDNAGNSGKNNNEEIIHYKRQNQMTISKYKEAVAMRDNSTKNIISEEKQLIPRVYESGLLPRQHDHTTTSRDHVTSYTSHGHSHDVTPSTSVSSIAWMVIMGDGLHNFTDGLAIGASFASSQAVGISTSVAVFCHELPHELGDFAVLLKAGMTIRQAILFNIVSSILCVIGVVIGILTASLIQMTSYIFSATAGIFIYIALVDMLPSLKCDSSGSRCRDLTLQLCGISFGIIAMFIIALYEEQIKSMTFDF